MKNSKRKKGVLEAAIIDLNHIRKFGESYEIRGRAATAHYLIQTVIALVDNDQLYIDAHVENVARDLHAAYELLSAVYGGEQYLDSVARNHVYYARRVIEGAIEAYSVNWLTGGKQ